MKTNNTLKIAYDRVIHIEILLDLVAYLPAPDGKRFSVFEMPLEGLFYIFHSI